MTTTPGTRSLRSLGRRLVGAVSAGVAVAVVGIGAVPSGTAAAAGLHRGHSHVAAAEATDPADLPTPPSPGSLVTYRFDGRTLVAV